MKRLFSTITKTISRPPVVNITSDAAKRLHDIGDGSDILFEVKGGGCNGFNYNLELIDENIPRNGRVPTYEPNKFDETVPIEPKGSSSNNNLIISSKSLPKVIGVEIDYSTDLMGTAFTFKNPNASSECGCGTSFNVSSDDPYN
jgi:iron-sulfur cluster insertion protein